MDDIAYNSDLTQVDRAERARAAWKVYADEYGDILSDFLADLLHVADVDDIDTLAGNGAYGVLRTAIGAFEAEAPTFPVDHESMWSQFAQVRISRESGWVTVAGADTPPEAAEHLRRWMSEAGFYASELTAHCQDLAEGYELIADDGREFRVISKTDAAAEAEGE